MNPRIYDLSMLVGILCCVASAWMLAGAAVAIGVGGLLLMISTVIGAILSVLSAKR